MIGAAADAVAPERASMCDAETSRNVSAASSDTLAGPAARWRYRGSCGMESEGVRASLPVARSETAVGFGLALALCAAFGAGAAFDVSGVAADCDALTVCDPMARPGAVISLAL